MALMMGIHTLLPVNLQAIRGLTGNCSTYTYHMPLSSSAKEVVAAKVHGGQGRDDKGEIPLLAHEEERVPAA